MKTVKETDIAFNIKGARFVIKLAKRFKKEVNFVLVCWQFRITKAIH